MNSKTEKYKTGWSLLFRLYFRSRPITKIKNFFDITKYLLIYYEENYQKNIKGRKQSYYR